MSFKTSKHTQSEPSTPIRRSIQELVDERIQMGREARTRKETQQNEAAVLPSQAVLQRWADACRRAFPKTPMPLVPKEHAFALKAAMARHAKERCKVPFLELMNWSIEHWLLIMEKEFFGMDNKPMYPAIRLFVKCIGKFQNAWSEKEKLIAVSKMTTREQMVYHLTRKGRSQEAAEREVDERLGLTKMRNEIASERAQLQRLQTNSVEHELLLSRIRMMDRTVERKQIRAVKGVGGTFEQWT